MNNWISIEDKLPEIDEDVLVTFIGALQCPIVTTAYLYGERLYKNRPTFFSTSGVSLENVVAWMSLPEPYTGE